jgi:hypothetical protein
MANIQNGNSCAKFDSYLLSVFETEFPMFIRMFFFLFQVGGHVVWRHVL